MNGMPYHRRSSLRPINSLKNVVQDVAIIAGAGTGNFNLIEAVDAPVLANTQEVGTGCRINQIYLEVWIYGNAVAGVNSPITWMLWKNNASAISAPTPTSLGVSDSKKYSFAVGKGLVGSSANGQPGYLIRGWFSIPKSMRRMGHDDRIQLVIENSTANDLNVCRLAIYKWYK